MIYNCEKKGLKIVLKSASTGRDDFGKPKKIDGIYIKFQDGTYETTDDKIIKFMDEYIKKSRYKIMKVDPKDLEKKKKIAQRVKEEVEKEEKEEKAKAEKK